MTNREWLSGLSNEELAEELVRMIFSTSDCNFCVHEKEPVCEGCQEGITEWLNAKHEKPMPEIKAGDLLFYSKESYYVAIAPDKLVTLRGYVVVDLENAIRKDYITTVKRWNDGGLATIWRADK